jgi:putative ABC transport system permease protein
MMIMSYLKIFVRDFKRNKTQSLINLSGLVLGISICLLLLLWVQDELSYDGYHEKSRYIYRVITQEVIKGKTKQFATTPAPLAPALVSEFPAIKKAVRFGRNLFSVRYKKKIFHEIIFFTDPDVFDVFTLPLVRGVPGIALKDPNSIIISENISAKYFGKDDPIGKIITLNENKDYKVTGVFKKIPRNSHFRYDFLGVFENFEPGNLNQWGILNYYTYILVEKDYPLNNLKKSLPYFVEKYNGKKALLTYNFMYLLQPLTRIHLYSDLKGELEPNGDIGTIYVIFAVALFILIIAGSNYINLTIAKYLNNAKEVGVRKVLGSTKFQLLKRFLADSLVLSLISVFFSILLAYLALPLANRIYNKDLSFDLINNPLLIAGALFIIIFVGFAAGIFPALFISSINPLKTLKGNFNISLKLLFVRRLLVVLQFAISVVFLIFVIIMFNQLNYMKNLDLGLDKKNIINIPINSSNILGKYETIKMEFLKNSNIQWVTASTFFPGTTSININYWREGLGTDEYKMIECISVDHDFIETFKLKIIEGRNFSRNFPGDIKGSFIINNSALKDFEWKSAVGKKLKIGTLEGTIIGVAADFHSKSLHNTIKPLVLFIFPGIYKYFSVGINPDNIQGSLHFLENKWKEFVPEQSFEYSFFEEDLDSLYETEIKTVEIITIIAILSVIISALGLFGFSAIYAEQRAKEICIRKILGESVRGILLLLFKDFAKFVILANILAWPIGWYAANKWLQNFSYRVNFSPWTFLFTGIFVLLIALLAVSSKTARAALNNPVKFLRYE